MSNSILRFNGEHPDPVSGITHTGNGYRAYNPILMRFNSPDSMSPFGAGGINPYAYCTSDPVNRADPSGHFSLGQWIGMGVSLLAGIALSIVTEGAAMPSILTLLATEASDTVIGAGSEIVTEIVDKKRINWGKVGISAGMNAVAALAGYGLGIASKLKGTSNRPFGQLMMESMADSGAIGTETRGNTNSHGLLEKEFHGPLYRAQRSPLEGAHGFNPSSDFTAVTQMTDGVNNTLIVSTELIGARRYFERVLNSQGNIYEIEPHGVKGVSLLDNISRNKKGVADFFDIPESELKTQNDISENFNGANHLFEAHVYLNTISEKKIRRMSLSEMKELEGGEWRNYF